MDQGKRGCGEISENPEGDTPRMTHPRPFWVEMVPFILSDHSVNIPSAMRYLVSKDGQQFGPFELDELTRHLQEGSILLTDHCWQEGWDQWLPVHSVVNIPAPPPVSLAIGSASPRSQASSTDEVSPRFSRRKLLVAGGIVAAILISCYFASPYWALYRLKRAVDRNDAIFVADRVDFPQLRESFKGAITASLAREATKGDADGFEALGAAFGAMLVGPMVDAFVTPEGLVQMMQGWDLDAILKEDPGPPQAGSRAMPPEAQVRDEAGMDVSSMGYETLNRFAVTIAGEPDASASENESFTFLFARRGLMGWKLAGVRIGPH